MISKALKIIRTFHKVKQKDFAEKIGIAPSYISEIENGKKEPSLDIISKYSEEFKIPISSILLFSEQIDENKTFDKLRVKSADKVLKMLEWIAKDN